MTDQTHASDSEATGQAPRDAFRSKIGFILAAAGSAVGLGNIWKFPYITGMNGGGLFVLIYLGCILLVGLPILVAEIMIGRASQRQPVAAFHKLQGKSSAWAGIGWLGVIGGFVILSFYVVVAGWAMDYTLKSIVNFTKPIAMEASEMATRETVAAEMPDIRRFLAKKELERAVKGPEEQIYARAVKSERSVKAARAEFDRYAAFMLEHSKVKAKEAGTPEDIALVAYAQKLLQEATPQSQEIKDLQVKLKDELVRAEDDYAQLVRLRRFFVAHTPILNQLLPVVQSVIDKRFADLGEPSDRWAENETRATDLAIIENIRLEIMTLRDKTFEKIQAEVLARGEKALRAAYETERRRELILASVTSTFKGVASDGWLSTFWAALIMLITILIVAGGVSGGIEAACRVLMPLLVVLILIMVAYGATTSGFQEALAFVFSPNADKLKPSGVLEALGHSFFTLSLGMGAMITYGSYQRQKSNILGQATMIAGLDTGIALLACLMMFPIVFSYGQSPSGGPGLVFMAMPLAFAEIGTGGMLLAVIFFALLVFAALTSSVSLVEVIGSYFKDEKGWSRQRAAWTLGGVTFLFALPTAFHADGAGLFTSWNQGYGRDFFDTMDYLSSNWMLPLGGLFISIYAGWIMPKRLRAAELEGVHYGLITGWLFLVRLVAPALVLVVLAVKIGLIDLD